MRLVPACWLLAACAASGGVTGCAKATTEAPKETVAPARSDTPAPVDGEVRIPEASKAFVAVEEVSGGNSGASVSAPVHVEFREGAVSQVGAPLDGRITALHVLIGQRVKSGDPLLTLDCPEATSLRSAQAVAVATEREASLELERQRRMQREGVGIDRDVVAAETRLATASAEVARLATTLAALGPGSGSTVVVRSSVSGVVTARKASVGLTVQRGSDALLDISNSASLWFVADVFERDLVHVRTGAGVRITLRTGEAPLAGKVASVGTVVATDSRTAPVYIPIDARNAALKPGMFGRAAIDAAGAGLALPVSAVLIKDGKDPVVYVQRDPLTYVRRRVVVGQPVEGRVQILSGLAPGDKVVVKGALLLDNAADALL